VSKQPIAKTWLAIALCTGALNAAQAVEYSLATDLAIGGQYDDNIELSNDGGETVHGTRTAAGALLKAREQNWHVSLDTTLHFSRFNEGGYDSDDQFVVFDSRWQGERQQAGLNAKLTRDTTRTSEALDSGRFSNARREMLELSPSYRFTLTEKNLLDLRISGQQVEYDDDRYVNYDYWSAIGQWTYIFNEQWQFFATLSGTNYTSDDREAFAIRNIFIFQFPVPAEFYTETESFGHQLGVSYQFNEKLNFQGLWGNTDTETSYHLSSESENLCNNDPFVDPNQGVCALEDFDAKSDLIDVSATWQEEQQDFRLGYSVQTQPSSDGYLLEYERYSLAWYYKLSQKNNFSVEGVYTENEALGGESLQIQRSSSDRNYYSLVIKYNHRLTEHWSISATGRYRFQERDNLPGSAESTGARIELTYRPKQSLWSR
jgi:hypothetical protein